MWAQKEETLPKNIASSIKDIKFLDFFFRQMRPVQKKDMEYLGELGVGDDYPFVSPCGKELNFIRPAATPIVFHTFDQANSNLIFGGALTQPFDPSLLAVSATTGRIFHQLTVHDRIAGKKIKTEVYQHKTPHFGLIKSSIAIALSENLHFQNDTEKLEFVDEGRKYAIPCLPEDQEGHSWALDAINEI